MRYRGIVTFFFHALALLLCAASRVSAQQPFPEVKLFIDADKAFVTKAGSEAAAVQFIRELVARTDAIYRSQAGITVTLADIHLWSTDDPFDRSTNSTFLASFAQYSEANYRGSISYDAAHLIAGNGLGGEGGIAYAQSACGGPFQAYAYGLSQPDIDDVYEFNAHLLAHELGHNLGAEHDEFPECKVKNIMCPGQIGADFSPASLASIASYVASRQVDGCFAPIVRSDPIQTVGVTASISKNTVKYQITGAQNCTSLSVVAAPSVIGLRTMFGYLQLGTATPAATILAASKRVPALSARKSKIYIGAYCDGQLAASRAVIDGKKIKSRLFTTSIITELRALQRTFRPN